MLNFGRRPVGSRLSSPSARFTSSLNRPSSPSLSATHWPILVGHSRLGLSRGVVGGTQTVSQRWCGLCQHHRTRGVITRA